LVRFCVASGLTISTTPSNNRMSITKTVSGNIIIAYSTQSEIGAIKSDDLFATAGTTITDVYETGTEEDQLMLFPASTADDNDAAGIFWDRSATAVSVKMYDDSEDTWTETAAASSMSAGAYRNWDASVRHSDSHILLASFNAFDNPTADIMTWDITPNDIASPTITAKTTIVENKAGSLCPVLIINQQNDDVYVAYIEGGSFGSTGDVVFHLSEDDMGSWGSEEAYSETTDDLRITHGGRTVGSGGGRIQWSWYNDDATAIYVNEVNDIEIAESAGTEYSESPTESLTFTNTLQKTTSKLISNTFTFADSVLTLKTVLQIVSESLTFTDSVSSTWVAQKTITESLTFSNTISKEWVAQLTPLESLTFTNTLQNTTSKLVSDTLTFTDSIQNTTSKLITDSLTFTDSVNNLLDIFRTITESLTFSDSVTAGLDRFRTVTESLSFDMNLRFIGKLGIALDRNTFSRRGR